MAWPGGPPHREVDAGEGFYSPGGAFPRRNPVIIRRATSSDVPAIIACVEATLDATYGGLWTSEPLRAGDDDWAGAWMACSDDAVIGVGLSEADGVSDLWVRPTAQGAGAGSALLCTLEGEIKARGYPAARLRCLEVNLKSRAFYRSRGWREVRIYRHEGIPQNTVEMTKDLA